MAYTEPPSMSAGARSFADPALWNTYIKGNLTELYDNHVALNTGIHGLPAGIAPVGLNQGAGYHIETFISEEFMHPGHNKEGNWEWAGVNFPFVVPFRTNPVVFMGLYCATMGKDYPSLRVGGVSPTGVELRLVMANARLIRVTGLAIGVQPDVGAGETNQIAWDVPKTWLDGEHFTYADYNRFVKNDPNWLKRNHYDLSNQVHGLVKSIYVLGANGAGKRMDIQRYPLGDKDTQETAVTINHAFTFATAFAANPVCCTACEYPEDIGHDQSVSAISTAGATGNHSLTWARPMYVSLIAVDEG